MRIKLFNIISIFLFFYFLSSPFIFAQNQYVNNEVEILKQKTDALYLALTTQSASEVEMTETQKKECKTFCENMFTAYSSVSSTSLKNFLLLYEKPLLEMLNFFHRNNFQKKIEVLEILRGKKGTLQYVPLTSESNFEFMVDTVNLLIINYLLEKELEPQLNINSGNVSEIAFSIHAHLLNPEIFASQNITNTFVYIDKQKNFFDSLQPNDIKNFEVALYADSISAMVLIENKNISSKVEFLLKNAETELQQILGKISENEQIEDNSSSFLVFIGILAVVLIIVIVLYLIALNKKRNKSVTKPKNKNVMGLVLKKPPKKEEVQEVIPIEVKTLKSSVNKAVPNIISENIFETSSNQVPKINSDWLVVGASVIGASHVKNNVPCQDSHAFEMLSDKQGIAIVADGAGSAENSHFGSAFVAKISAMNRFKELLKNWTMEDENSFPSEKEWNEKAIQQFTLVYSDLQDFAKTNNYELKSLACTLIVVVFSHKGLLMSHIGDGRAAWQNLKGEWLHLLTPWKGDEANATIFVTSAIWDSPQKYIESRVVLQPPKAFALMSDGCETHSFECSIIDNNTQKWNDPNRPFERFFQPISDHLRNMALKKELYETIQNQWVSFLNSGNEGLKNEPDDKTMIIGVLT